MTLIDKAEVLAERAIARASERYNGCKPHFSVKDADLMAMLAATLRAAIAALPARGVGVPQIVVDQLNVTVGEVGLEMVQDAEDAEFTGERPDLHDYQVSIPYDHAVAILAALAPTDAAHVNETPKSEHDGADVLTDAAQARERFEKKVNADLRGKFTAEELRLAADVLGRFLGQMNGPAEAMSLEKPTDAAQARSPCPYGATGDDCCGMDDDQKGGDAHDQADDPGNARSATSPGVTAGADAAHAPFRMEYMTLADLMRDPLYEAATAPVTDAAQAREAHLREAAAAVRARYMGDNNREDQEVLRCEAAILALIGERT